MPRFSDRPWSAPPDPLPPPVLVVRRDREPVAQLDLDDFRALGPRTLQADFHCVTTWSVRGVRWTGVPLRQVLEALGQLTPPAPYVVARAADHRRGHFVWEDALAEDVIVATHFDDRPLDGRSGGPLRLVAPKHYGYKSIKHLVGIDLRRAVPRRLGLEHLRGRVEREERHPKLPSWAVKLPYRLTIPLVAWVAERAAR